MRRLRKFFGALTALALCLTLLPAAAWAAEGVTYVSDTYENDTLTSKTASGRETRQMTEQTARWNRGEAEIPANRDGGSFTQTTVREISVSLPFADVAGDFWAHDAIAWAWENGYMSGVSASAFAPDAPISRQQIWMILARVSGQNSASMAEARRWALDGGISDGTNPGGAVTRQQLAALLYRFAQLTNRDTTQGGMVIWEFPDVGAISGYAEAAMDWAVSAGIMDGTSQGTLNPQGQASRAQFAVMLMRFCQLDQA